MSGLRSSRTASDLLFGLVRRGGLAVATGHALPGWRRGLCRQYGLTPGTVDVEHYARSAGRPFSSPEDAAFHYLAVGSDRGWSPWPGFSPDDYRRANPDTVLAGYEPFAHWSRFGRTEGRGAEAPDSPVPELRHLLEQRPPDRARASVDVVMPVYGGRALALAAIGSVLEAANRGAYDLVVVDDASPDPLLRADLATLAEAGLITLLVNERNVGFVGSVNRGMSLHPDRDVVLLNSDTRVFGDWLDRLLAALRTVRTATATPLSNAATILSYPATLCENRPVSALDAAHWDRLCAAIDAPVVEIPTAIGFCMAVSRTCLDQIGTFDQERFGRGYGEENDFCLRATAAGWRHVAAPGIFVWHRGGNSFGEKRGELIAAAQATLEALHPGYAASVGRFIRRDPLEPVRRALDIARIRADPRHKRLCLGPPVAPPADVLDVELVPDLPPYAGQYRLVPRGFGAVPNLPRLERSATTAVLASMFKELGIQEFRGGMAGAAFYRRNGRVRRALEMNGIS